MKKKWIVLMAATMIFSLSACVSSSSGTGQESKSAKPQKEGVVYGIGETWEVPGQWKLTVNSVTPTDERNEYDESNPAQVLIIDYSYENTGYVDDDGFMDGIFFDLSSGKVIDSAGTMGSSYPADITSYPQEVPVGANCNAQAAVGISNAGNSLKIMVEQYDGTGTEQNATFELSY